MMTSLKTFLKNARNWFLILLCVSPLVVLWIGNWSVKAQNAVDARAALRSGAYDKARQGFESGLRRRPDDEESQIGLLQTLRETGEYEEAAKQGDDFLKLSPNSVGLHFERGRTARELGDYSGAESHLRRALTAGANRRRALAELAGLLENLGRTPEANNLWDELIGDYQSGRITGGQDLGVVALAAWRRGYVEDAKDFFIDATGVKPDATAPLETLSNFGYLFLEKYNATDASGVFRDCLKINKSYPPALLGMALAKQYENTSEVEVFARAALQVNKNYVPALNLLAELRVQEERYEDANRMVESALAVNPRDLESLSLKAVVCQIREDASGFERVEKEILAINKSYGRLYYTLAENLIMRRKYQEAVEFNRKAVDLDPALHSAYASMGMNLMRVGNLEEGRRMVRRAFEGDPFNVWAFNTLDLLDQMDSFKTVRSEHFVFKMAPEDERVVAPYASKIAEEAHATLTARYGFVPEGPIQVEIFPDHGGFAVRTLGLPGLGALGVCFGKVVAMDSPRARETGDFNWGTTLWHELVHVMTLQMTRHNIPRWFSEGLSVFEEQKARPGWGDDLTAGFIKAYKEGKLLKISELNSGMMRPKSPEQIELSYFQAALFCNMIEEKFGFEKIKESLALFAQNKPAGQVFLQTLGWDAGTLDSQYAAFLDSRFKSFGSRLNFERLTAQAAADAAPGKSELEALLKKDPDDFFANLQLGIQLREEKSYAAAETHLKKAEALFPSFVEPGNPYEILAGMYLEIGREDDALAQVVQWSRYDETAVSPLIQAAEIYRKRKDWANATRFLELLVYIDPYDPEVHASLGECAMEASNWPAAIAAFQVLLGLNPPDPAGAHYNLARAFYGSGRTAEAKKETLRSLEIAPTFEKAQQLLLKLNERK